jgi:exopolysaccharide biosynthesis polyprenyl glycosylphosphotransferase
VTGEKREMSVMGRLRHSGGATLAVSSDPGRALEGSGMNGHGEARAGERLLQAVDPRTRALIEQRRGVTRGRGYMVRRWLLASDVVALTVAFLLSIALTEPFATGLWVALGIFVVSLPIWVVAAKLLGLYDRDDRGFDYSTADDVLRVLLLVSLGALVLDVATGYTHPDTTKVLLFWVSGVSFLLLGRAAARAVSRRTASYVQNTVIVGAGDAGQLIARKLRQHPEYGINLVGFVDAEPKAREEDLEDVVLLGPPDDLPRIIQVLRIDRVIIAFFREDIASCLDLMRRLKKLGVHVDIVPRFFEVVGPNADIHTIESLPLLSLPTPSLGRSSWMIKRAMDIVGAALALVLTAPLFAYIAWRVKRGSAGPVFFRQRRLGRNQREFTLFKFRTMQTDAGDAPHREYIEATMKGGIKPASNGLYKLDRSDAVTSVGQWLRKTSLDELPQLINVLRGDMSLVGPRPCLPYEIEHYQPHHFERFLVPAGMTGLWQVTARAKAHLGDALDIDVLYARSWSLGLDLNLILRTPVQLFRSTGTV